MNAPLRGLRLGSLALLALLFVLPLPVGAQGTPDAASQSQARRFVYGYDREFPPFSYERDGQAAGFDVELLRQVLEGQDVTLMPRAMAWDQVLLDLSAGSVQLSSGMVKTQQRVLLYQFPNRPTLSLRARFFMKDFKRVANINQLQGKRVGVKKDSLYETMLKERGGSIVVPFDSDLLALRAVQEERVDAYLGPDRTAYFLMDKLGIPGISPVGTPLAVTNVYYAVYREEEELRRQIDEGLRWVRESGAYDALFRQWFVKELSQEQIKTLVTKAREAAAFAYTPYGGAAVGGAVLGRTGTVYTGCSVENGLPQLNAGGLQVAIQNAVAGGEIDFLGAVSVLEDGSVVAPSADERRLLFEFGPEILVINETGKGRYETLMVSQLLPFPQDQEPQSLPPGLN